MKFKLDVIFLLSEDATLKTKVNGPLLLRRSAKKFLESHIKSRTSVSYYLTENKIESIKFQVVIEDSKIFVTNHSTIVKHNGKSNLYKNSHALVEEINRM